jgi:hypothetical protein
MPPRLARRANLLLWASLGLACSHPLKNKTGADAAEPLRDAAAPTAETGAGDDTAAGSVAEVTDRPEALRDGSQGDTSPLPDARDSHVDTVETATLGSDGSPIEAADAAVSETSLWSDAHWLIDGPCSYNPPDLMRVLAASLEPYEIFCTRTAVSTPEGDRFRRRGPRPRDHGMANSGRPERLGRIIGRVPLALPRQPDHRLRLQRLSGLPAETDTDKAVSARTRCGTRTRCRR